MTIGSHWRTTVSYFVENPVSYVTCALLNVEYPDETLGELRRGGSEEGVGYMSDTHTQVRQLDPLIKKNTLTLARKEPFLTSHSCKHFI